MEILLISIIVILIMIFSGVALPFSFLAGCIVFTIASGTSFGNFIQTSFSALNSYSIIAMPMFMIAGTLIEKSGIANTLIDAAERLIGRIKGGMAMTIPLVACFFGALSGSGTATCTTLSSMMVPRLNELGYKKKYLAALVAACGPLGYMIPPNVNALIFNRVSSASVAGLFLATIIPGVIWCLAFFLIIRLNYKKYYTPPTAAAFPVPESDDNTEREISASSKLTGTSFGKPMTLGGASVGVAVLEQPKRKTEFWKGVISAVMMPVIIMGGIYGGIFSATEAGAVGCLYALIVGIVIFKKFNIRGAFKHFITTGSSLGSLMILFPMTYIFSRILVMEQVPSLLTDFILGITSNKYIILLMIDIILFIAGFFVDCSVLQLVFVPLLIPICAAIGITQTHLAVIMFVCIGVGTITPPMAMNIFITARITELPTKDVIQPIWPFVTYIGFPMILLVTYVPAISEWLPKLVLGSIT